MKLAAMIKKMCPSEAELSIPAKNCYRMVILGSSKVGKTAIVSRFLTGRFEEQYTPTIEDFHRKFYSIRGEVYQLDILDTSGNHPFPAMRRLSILTGTWLRSSRRKRGFFCWSWGGFPLQRWFSAHLWVGCCACVGWATFLPGSPLSCVPTGQCVRPHLTAPLRPQVTFSSSCSAWTTGTPSRRCSA